MINWNIQRFNAKNPRTNLFVDQQSVFIGNQSEIINDQKGKITELTYLLSYYFQENDGYFLVMKTSGNTFFFIYH